MKIVYISFSFIPSRTANSLHVMKMCEALAQNGHEVYLLTPDKRDEYESNVDDFFKFYNTTKCFKLIRIPFPKIKGKLIVFWPILVYHILSINPDLVYGRYIAGIFFAAMLGYPVVFESHSPIWESSKIENLLFKNLIKKRNFRKLVVISESLKKVYIKQGLVFQGQITVAHDAANVMECEKRILNWPGRESTLQVGYVGNLYKGKGIEIIHKIARKLDAIDFHIIGGFPSDIEQWKEKIGSNNVFFHGFITQEDISCYLNRLDICLLPNQRKVHTHGLGGQDISLYTSPLKMFEYMANKKAIIASDLPVLREVLVHKHNAWLCNPENEDEWISAITELKHDINLRIKLAINAYTDFINKYTWKIRAKKILE